jgi:hypothetical protein
MREGVIAAALTGMMVLLFLGSWRDINESGSCPSLASVPAGSTLAELNYPLYETQDEWIVHGFSYANYLQELGPKAQSEIYKKFSIDLAMRDAFRKMRIKGIGVSLGHRSNYYER